jgi:hypothetical protein
LIVWRRIPVDFIPYLWVYEAQQFFVECSSIGHGRIILNRNDRLDLAEQYIPDIRFFLI